MSDIYKIAVNLAMTSNAPAFLSALSGQLLHVHTHVKDLEGSLMRLSKIKLAVGGGLAIAGGTAMLEGLKKLSEQAKDLSHQLATIKTFKVDPAQGAALAEQAQRIARATTRAVPGTTEAGNIKLFGESYSMFGAEGASRINPNLARFGQVLGGITGNYEGADEQLYAMLKSGDLMGKLVNEKTHQVDPNKLLSYLDVAAKVAAATHGKVGPNTLFQLAQQGGPALSNMSDEGLIGMLMAAQGMGGARAGTALTSLYQQFVGGTMTESKAKELHRLGLIGKYRVGRGGHLVFDAGSKDTEFTAALSKDPTKAVEIMEKAMAAHSIRSTEDQTKELFNILGRQTTQRLISDFVRNLPQMLGERGRLLGAQGTNQQAATRNAEDYETAEHNMEAAWTNLMQAVSGPNAKASIGVMNMLAGALNRMTEVTRNMKPETLEAIGKGLAGLGLSLTGGGAVALVAALGPVGWLSGGLIALGGAVASFKPDALKEFADGLKQAWDGILHLDFKTAWTGILKEWDGLVHMLPDKMQAGIAALDIEIRSWPGRLASAVAEMGRSLVAMVGDMFKGLFAKLNPFSKTSFEGSGFGGGIINASYGGGANDNFRVGSGRYLGSGGGGGGGGGAVGGYGGLADDVMNRADGAGFNTRGVRNMNPGNIGWGGWARAHGAVSGAGADSGHLVAVFPSFEAGYAAMGALALSKYGAGARSIDQLIAGVHGWTPGNHAAAANVARMMGISPFADAHLNDPAMMAKFKAGLSVQELGPAGAKYARGHVAGPPPKPKPQPTHPPAKIQMDGQTVARLITDHQAHLGQFPTAVGGIDPHGSFASPGTYLPDVA